MARLYGGYGTYGYRYGSRRYSTAAHDPRTRTIGVLYRTAVLLIKRHDSQTMHLVIDTAMVMGGTSRGGGGRERHISQRAS